MKIQYNIRSSRGQYETDKFFTYGKIYNVIADYRKRDSKQTNRDNGFIVIDNLGQNNMLFENEIVIVDNNIDNTFIFNYNNKVEV